VHVRTKLLAAALAVAALVAATPAGAGPPIELPALTRIASKLSGLQSHAQIRVVNESAAGMQRQAERLLDRDYPADEQAYDETLYRALGLLRADEALRPLLAAEATRGVVGLYDPVDRTLYVRSGSTRNAAVLQGLVHALQDQTFDLRRLTWLRRGDRDAAFAAAAAVEGDATFAVSILGGRVLALGRPAPRTTSAYYADPIKPFLALEHEFPFTTGASFVTTLHNLGGNPAVFSALRQFPTTTAQIFHIDSFLAREPSAAVPLPAAAAGFSLVRSDTFGELDVRALLAVFQVPRLDEAGDGWAGGRSALYHDGSGRPASAVAFTWETDLDAQQWQEAAATFVNEAYDADAPGFPPTTPCAADACWLVGGRAVASTRHGERTAFVVGDSVSSAASLATAIVSS
jgi:hypothetical protein